MTASLRRGWRLRSRPRLVAWSLSALVVAVFVAANAHLVAVSFASHPGCADPAASPGGGAATYRAAKASC